MSTSSGLSEFTWPGMSAIRDLLAESHAEFDREQRELEALFDEAVAIGDRGQGAGTAAEYDSAACQFAVLTQTLDEERQARRQQQLEITRELRAMRGLLERQLDSAGLGGQAAGKSLLPGAQGRSGVRNHVA